MSTTETWKGRIIPTGKTLSEVMADVPFLSYLNPDDPHDMREMFWEEFGSEGKKVLIHGEVYDVEADRLDYDDIYEASKNEDGSYEFVVQFYNGGCDLEDALTEAIERTK